MSIIHPELTAYELLQLFGDIVDVLEVIDTYIGVPTAHFDEGHVNEIYPTLHSRIESVHEKLAKVVQAERQTAVSSYGNNLSIRLSTLAERISMYYHSVGIDKVCHLLVGTQGDHLSDEHRLIEAVIADLRQAAGILEV